MRDCMARREASDEIDAAAALWAARVDAAPLSQADQDSLDTWLAADTRRIGAYARARATLVRVEVARALGPSYDPERFLIEDAPSTDVIEGAGDGEAPAGAAETDRPGITRRRMLWMTGSAAAAAGVGALGLAGLDDGLTYETAKGEMRRIAMPDGSVVNLNTASSIYVRFSETRRSVFLRSGEVLFEVAKDRSRPFVVTAGNTKVEAIGTAFTVRRQADSPVSVLVSEGVVEVAHTGRATPPVRLTQNMRAEADDHADAPIAAVEVDAETVERQLFWREGKIGFRDATLADAAEEFGRYNAQRIVISDPAVAERRITGLFVATDPDGFAQAAAASFGFRTARDGDVITITAS